ncbi:MAG: hypothetical protein KAK00_03065 [Nanoarchaeota archaeon]|nr:hypothetical protein [Nanoarchaeota archaeon]
MLLDKHIEALKEVLDEIKEALAGSKWLVKTPEENCLDAAFRHCRAY